MPAAVASARTLLLDRWHCTIRDAAITVTDSLGTVRAGVAEEVSQGEEIALHVKDLSVYSHAWSPGGPDLGEAHMDGQFEVTAEGLDGLWTVLVHNRTKQKSCTNPKFLLTDGSILLGNWRKPHAANIHTHSDEIGQDVFEAFGGPSLAYTGGDATSPDDDLEPMHYAKLDRVCRKVELKASERPVDPGCGWGSLLLRATPHYGVQGYGITSSAAHAAIVRSRAQAAGVADRVHVQDGDFSTMTGTYDKLAAVGMYEYLRPAAYAVLFDTIATRSKKRAAGAAPHTPHELRGQLPRSLYPKVYFSGLQLAYPDPDHHRNRACGPRGPGGGERRASRCADGAPTAWFRSEAGTAWSARGRLRRSGRTRLAWYGQYSSYSQTIF